ncbi:Hypothetical protein D9617_1g086480 [Elsinoe fawcettii]|nr:Hypothetical protein D9617_1g086480 [Elsinoe fawcettii]
MSGHSQTSSTAKIMVEQAMRPMMFAYRPLTKETGVGILEPIATAYRRLPVRINVEYIADEGCEFAYVIDFDSQSMKFTRDKPIVVNCPTALERILAHLP